MGITKRGVIACFVAGIAASAVLLGVSSTANAIPQSNPSFPTVTCGGTWHWVHNQLPAGTTGGTLTATFANAGTVTIVGVPKGPVGAPSTIHYTTVLASGDTLISASDDIAGGMLLLSDFPVCETPTPSVPPTPSESPSPSESVTSSS